jgi:NAD(P)-dependent dehydrogenase (short-subunit alcohol dehydrogenase family)
MPDYLIITGGSRGIGEKTVACFQRHGWLAVNISRSSCPLPEVANLNIDLSSSHEIEKKSAPLLELTQNASKICLVHNAAFYKRDRLDSLSMDDLQRSLQTNLVSCVALNKILIPIMKPESSIIYIGSTLALKAVPGSASYTISKHALVGLMKVTCQDLIGKDIHTCCICPGLVDTKLLKETMDDETINYIINNVVIGKRLIQPEEIANIIYFCAMTNVINGVTLPAHLGQVAD